MTGSVQEPAPVSGNSPGAGREPAIWVHGLAKSYDEIEAVRGIDFEVAPGEIFGFLGPNGAGKSTTISMLCTLTRPAAGRPAWPATT